MILGALLVLVAGAAAAPLLYRWMGARAGWVLALLPLVLFLALAARLPDIADGRPIAERTPWIPSLGIDLAFRIDGLALLFLLVILGIGALILLYGSGYLKGHPLQGRFFGYLLLFMIAMCGMVSADNTILLFVFWELTGIASYLLIGFYHEDAKARSSALQALLVTFLGGQALLAGLVLLSIATGGSFSLSETLEQREQVTAHPWYPAILLLILLGAFTKSAQFPFHFWLPGAMSAPAPVSAYLHSATMVNAGIFLMARMAPALAGTELWRGLATTAGVATMLAGALLAYPQADLKKLLAYSTVSALGTMILLLGLDTVLAVKAAMLFFLVHALYKGALFMAAGTVDHETGTRDVRVLSGLAKAMPLTTAAAVGAGLSMCGLPPLVGFISKELLYEAKLAAPYIGPAVTAAGVAANVLMVAVGLIVAFRPFHGTLNHTPKPPHEGKWTLWLPPLTLALLGILFGLAPGLIDRGLIAPAVSAVRAQETEVTLKLWHGINPVLMLSIATVATGFVVFRLRHRARPAAERIAQSGPGSLGPARLYEWLLEGMVQFAKFLTHTLQHGSLRGYVGVAVSVMVAVTGAALLRIWSPAALVWDFSDLRPYEGVLLIAMIAGAVFAALSNSRLAAIASLSVVGFGVALVFGMYGAPDLALTQLLVETLTLVILVLVIYRLPRIASRSTPRQQIADAILALSAGAVITVLLLIAQNLHPEPVLRDYFVQNSLEAKGRNVVNVILVDFRALDTLGEITVLAAAALGVGGLIWLRPRRKQPEGGES
jgi:multicomponent Na+:H+ antiporter subunit A